MLLSICSYISPQSWFPNTYYFQLIAVNISGNVSFFLISLQIGLAVGDIESVQKNAELKRLRTQVSDQADFLFNTLASFLSTYLSQSFCLQSQHKSQPTSTRDRAENYLLSTVLVSRSKAVKCIFAVLLQSYTLVWLEDDTPRVNKPSRILFSLYITFWRANHHHRRMTFMYFSDGRRRTTAQGQLKIVIFNPTTIFLNR